MRDDGFAAYGIEAVCLDCPPTFGFGIKPGAALVVLWALATGLVFRGHANPYPYLPADFWLHTGLSKSSTL